MRIKGGLEGSGGDVYYGGDRVLPKGYKLRHAAKLGEKQAEANVISLIHEIVEVLENYKFQHEQEEWKWTDVVDWSRDFGLCRGQVPCCTDPCPLALAQLRIALGYALSLYRIAATCDGLATDRRDWSIIRDAERLCDHRPHPKYHTHSETGLYVFPWQPDVAPVPPRYGLHVSERVFPKSRGPWDAPSIPYCD